MCFNEQDTEKGRKGGNEGDSTSLLTGRHGVSTLGCGDSSLTQPLFPSRNAVSSTAAQKMFLSETSWCPGSFLDNQEQEQRVSQEHLQVGIREVLGFLRVSCLPTPVPRWVSMTTLHFRSFSWFL